MGQDDMNEKSSRNFWIFLILAFFAIDLTIAVIAISMAAGDPSFRSIPGFGERSVHWDERRNQHERLVSLGWSIQVDKSRSGKDSLAIEITDRQGKPVDGISLQVNLFHYTRVAEQQKAHFRSVDSMYIAPVKLSKPGLWHIDLDGTTPEGERIWSQLTLDWDRQP